MLRSGRSLAAVPMLVALSACASQTATADSQTAVAIPVGQARHTIMPRLGVAIGRILPGAEPFTAAPAGGSVVSYAVHAGQSVARGAVIATILPPTGKAVVVRAPVRATITRILVPAGQTVNAGTPLVGLRGRRVREAELPFSVARATRFRVGDPVYLHSPLNPRGRLAAQVVAVEPDKHNDVTYLYTDLPPLPGFTPGSPVRADLVLAEKNVISVPAASVALRRIGTVVFVVHDGHVQEHLVRVHFRSRARVAVSGIAAGARVAAGALDRLHNGTRVRVRQDG